jgi:FkbM family methyltransferase
MTLDARALKREVKVCIDSHSSLRVLLRLGPLVRSLLRAVGVIRLSDAYDGIFNTVDSGSAVVRVPDHHGTFEIDCRSHILKQLLCEKSYEPEVVEVIAHHLDPTRDAIDVGANVGLFTVLIARSLHESRRVLAIEPTNGALEYLRRNIERNHCAAKVPIFAGVAADRNGEFPIRVMEGMEEYSSIVAPQHQGPRAGKQFLVHGETIDSLVQRFDLTPGFIKMDAEGAEYRILSGALNTLRTHRPVIVSELSEALLSALGATSRQVCSLLEANGYLVKKFAVGQILATPTGL